MDTITRPGSNPVVRRANDSSQRHSAVRPVPARHLAKHVGTSGSDGDYPEPREVRNVRWFAREAARSVTGMERLRHCGRRRHATAEAVSVVRNVESGTASYAGVQTCGSVWACPVCANKIRRERQGQIDLALDRHRASGGGVEFLTLTLRHRRADRLSDLIDACADGWRALQRERWWRRLRKGNPFGFIRALEVTFTWQNGWHAHLHVLLLTSTVWQADTRAAARDALSSTWAAWAMSALGKAPSRRHGVVWEPATDSEHIGRYLTKLQEGKGQRWGLAGEVARSDVKLAGHGSLHPFELAELASAGHARALAKWREFEAGTHGRQAITWSSGLKARLVPDWKELSDADAAASAAGLQHVAYVGDRDMSALRFTGLMHAVLVSAEAAGVAGVDRVLEFARRLAWDTGWRPPPTRQTPWAA